MAKTKISEYSSTPANNTDISNININEGCSPSGINNAIRTLMAQLKNWQGGTSGDTLPVASGGTGSATASTARTALSAAASGANSDITSLSGLTTPLSVAQGGTGATLVSTATVARATDIATITTSAAHTLSVNDVVNITGCTISSFNVATATVLSVANANTFTFSQAGSSLPDVASTSDTTGKVLDLSYVSLTNNVTGTLAVNKGGTGNTSIAKNKLVVGNNTGALSTIAPSTVGNVLRSTTGSTITAGSFVVGVEYTILTVGTTNFTLIGAASNTVGVVFTATGVGTGDGTATENTWTSGSYTPDKLSTASGSAPSYSARAFVKFNAAVAGSSNISATYTHSGNAATVAATAHGLSVGHRVWLDFTTGIATDSLYTVTSVTDANNFVATGTFNGTAIGNVTLQRQAIDYGKNVAFVSRTSTTFTTFVINFTTPMETVNAPTLVTAQTSGYVSAASGFLQDVNSVVVVVTASSAIVNVATFE